MLSIIMLIIIAALVALVFVIRDAGREIKGLDSSGKGKAERKDEELTKEIERWREG